VVADGVGHVGERPGPSHVVAIVAERRPPVGFEVELRPVGVLDGHSRLEGRRGLRVGGLRLGQDLGRERAEVAAGEGQAVAADRVRDRVAGLIVPRVVEVRIPALAVGLEDGLMMPVIKNCQSLGLEEVVGSSRALIEKVKAGSCGKAELAGGNFAISNLGMLGVEQFGALVPPGMTAILAVGGITDEVMVKDGDTVPFAKMRVTLVADHRVTDGLYSAQFLVELKRLLENPEELQA